MDAILKSPNTHSIARSGGGFDVAAACFARAYTSVFPQGLWRKTAWWLQATHGFCSAKARFTAIVLVLASFKNPCVYAVCEKVFALKKKFAVVLGFVNELNQINLRALNASSIHDWNAFKAFVDEGRRVTSILAQSRRSIRAA